MNQIVSCVKMGANAKEVDQLSTYQCCIESFTKTVSLFLWIATFYSNIRSSKKTLFDRDYLRFSWNIHTGGIRINREYLDTALCESV